MRFFINKIIMAKKSKPVIPAAADPNVLKVKVDEPWKAPIGPEAWLAQKNQVSGPHTLKEHKEKNKQKFKNLLREQRWDD